MLIQTILKRYETHQTHLLYLKPTDQTFKFYTLVNENMLNMQFRI